jgi:hypothetical protein
MFHQDKTFFNSDGKLKTPGLSQIQCIVVSDSLLLISRSYLSLSEIQLPVILNKRDMEMKRFKMLQQGAHICEGVSFSVKAERTQYVNAT